MRIFADLKNHRITQVEATQADTARINGRFLFDTPAGIPLDVAVGDLLASSTIDAAFGNLAAQLPSFPHFHANMLLAPADLSLLDHASTVTIGMDTVGPRLQTGNPITAVAPNMTALLPLNGQASPAKPGMLLTTSIDISTDVPMGGVDTFLVYWDVRTSSSTQDGPSGPVIKTLSKPDQNLSSLAVYLSNDGGDHWTRVRWMQPVRLFDRGSDVRLCLLNNDASEKLYVLGYAVFYGQE